ncbi:virulence factor family protein [Mesorhizobium muleiense]|uniref:virulence factor family protein n=1 Tax=Mesorhizobium muleiense TaxID=1004279 RepID=UPI001F2688D4|nr:AcvB/VirJ family lysyl-phosphatidylglycerol hydrolase [Mesorhizobium muleiense]MCF6112189.1 virulence factor family protein [Mesorhizobium muleiense]
MRLLLIALLLLFGLAVPSHAAEVQTVSTERLVDIPVRIPDGDPSSLVVYFSDRSGWTSSDDSMVEALRAAGSIVLSVDLSKYAKALDADDGACLYVVGEITDLAQKAQRELDVATYLPPIVVGSGEGATFAYAALADAPDNTFGGAIGIGFENRLGLKLRFCPGAKATPVAGGGFSYGFDRALPGKAYLSVDPQRLDAINEQVGDADNVTVDALKNGKATEQAVAAVKSLMENQTIFGDIPVVDIDPPGKPSALAIFVSGDGGWRDLDKTIGEWMARKDIHVLGLDALHYFWSQRNPKEFAADLATLIEKGDPTGDLPIMLIGYSFGADTLPFTWSYLPPDLQGRIRLVGLLAPGQTTSFQVSVSGWLGMEDGDYKIVPAIAALPADRVLCVYGEEEDDSACPDPSLNSVTRVKTAGGHHFDEDYEKLGQAILDAFQHRKANAASAQAKE